MHEPQTSPSTGKRLVEGGSAHNRCGESRSDEQLVHRRMQTMLLSSDVKPEDVEKGRTDRRCSTDRAPSCVSERFHSQVGGGHLNSETGGSRGVNPKEGTSLLLQCWRKRRRSCEKETYLRELGRPTNPCVIDQDNSHPVKSRPTSLMEASAKTTRGLDSAETPISKGQCNTSSHLKEPNRPSYHIQRRVEGKAM